MRIIIVVFALLIIKDGFTQDCRTNAENKPTTITRSEDVFGPSNQKPGTLENTKMKSNLGKMGKLDKNPAYRFYGR